ncbi:FUSC family protein [Cryobacterium tagatosivorans]|uniref:FUSC family protein n=1 Tax=Cryobacterium tagatosivorans TaxID=1259199 RepID=A0A4R8UII6_9MICO|nr:aromatic acid exporter family protein [Cryobacterium tagatosivorans]TFB53092.1 FUSC family protein [Cryobacterium tagatosivorans]
MRLTASLRTTSRVPLLQAVKTAVATVLAWLIAQVLLPGELPIFAAIAALLVVQPSINQSLGKAVERSLGVIGGVIIAYVIGLLFGRSSWIVLLTIVICILLAWALKLPPGSANQVPISAMLVLSIGSTSPAYALDRIIETVIGAGIALIVNVLIVPPVLLAPAHEAVGRLAHEVADTLDRLAAALRAPQKPFALEELMLTARLLRPMQESAERAITQAEESLAFNPRQASHRRVLDADVEQYRRLKALVTRGIGMTRAFRDHYDDSLHREPTVQAFSQELGRAAHDLRLLAPGTAAAEEQQAPTAGEPAALTAPLIIRTPHPEHWILIGSLMEDLRRVREEIVGEQRG